MLLLASTSDKLQLVTSSTSEISVHADWVDHNAGTVTHGRTNGSITSAGATTDVVASPSGSAKRNVRSLFARNKGAAANDVTVQHTDGSTVAQLFKLTLQPGCSLAFLDGVGFLAWDGDGAGVLSRVAGEEQGALIRRTTYTSGTNTFTPGARARQVLVRLVGGGAGGGGAQTGAGAAAAGSGGGAGAYIERWLQIVPGKAYTSMAVVGGTANGGSTAGGNGTTGTNSTFTLAPPGAAVTATGGTSGQGMLQNTTELLLTGAAGGVPVAPENAIGVNGKPGGPSWRRSGTVAYSGPGGSSRFGKGGEGLLAAGTGNAGTGYGSGGGGALVLNGSAGVAGGRGQGGIIIIDEYT